MAIIDYKVFFREIQKSADMANKRVMLKALKLSSGKYKAQRLAKMGHPYATRHLANINAPSIPYGDPGIINIQSGNFYLSWQRITPVLVGNNLNYGVTNTSPYAKNLAMGKESTIPRPLIVGLLSSAEYWQKYHLLQGIKNAVAQLNK